MAEDPSRHEYRATSNLVINVDSRQRGEIGPSSEVQSLASKKDARTMMAEMGSRAKHAATDNKQPNKAPRPASSTDEDRQSKRTKHSHSASALLAAAPASLTTAVDVYHPQTAETRRVYDTLLSHIATVLPSINQHDTLTSAAYELLVILKQSNITIKEQRQQAEQLLNKRLNDEQWRLLVNIIQRITDFDTHITTEGRAEVGAGEVDDRVGVSVLLDEVDEDDEVGDDDNNDAIRDEDSEHEQEVDEDEAGDDEEDDTIDDSIDTATDTILQRKADQHHDTPIDTPHPMLDDDNMPPLDRPGTAAPSSVSTAFDVRAIDAYWIQRQITAFTPDALTSQSLAQSAFTTLSSLQLTDGAVETALVSLLGFERFGLIKLLVSNRWAVVYATRLARAADESEREAIVNEMKKNDRARSAYQQLTASNTTTATATGPSSSLSASSPTASTQPSVTDKQTKHTDAYWLKQPRSLLDLDTLTFSGGAHQMSNTDCKLPKGSEIFSKKNYQEVHVPALKPLPMGDNERLVRIADMPSWAQPAFEGMSELNRIQSRVYECAMNSVENMLVCAPTGGGKTNVAMLAMLHEIGQYRDSAGQVQLDRFKIVYIAPMKSLVAEMVLNFGKRLAPYGMKVAELSGDQQLSREQLESVQVIVTTPEKWDIITRKAGDRLYTQLVRLLIIDEIHLLHDSRGPVLESIVTRTLRQIETEQELVRLVGLSATLPNYDDVALFLRVKPDRGLYHFDNSYRPVPLQQCYIGLTLKKAFKRMQLMNDICYEKVLQCTETKQQVLVFVHSRKDTAVTARMIRDRAQEQDELVRFIRDDEEGRKEVLRVESESVQSEHLKSLIPHGFAIHHAGMTRKDRTLVEELFADGHIQVLVCTATLAWGVNLPAHTVIIKGTQVYSPEKGDWMELSHLDVMQMLGRAGRPQYDKSGEGIIITSHAELQYYLSLLNQQLPVESQFIAALPDQLNAEVVAGSISTLKEAVEWLSYTYLYVRMLRRPKLYGITAEQAHSDPYLEQRRVDLVHTAATVLDKAGLIKYDRRIGSLHSTELGRVASHYYLSHSSIATYNEHLKPTMTDIELFRLFSLSGEFKHIGVREEEKVELAKLLDKVPIPVKEDISERSAKVNVLLQSYISRLTLDGFALMADLVYITQSAGRITRALFEIVVRRGWSGVAVRLLTMAKMVEHRCWEAQSPLRQFPQLSLDHIRRIEGKDLTLTQLLDIDAPAIGELLRNPRAGTAAYKLLHHLPHLELTGHVQPITRTLLRIELTITPDFAWSDKYHGVAEPFWVLVEDVDGEQLLHYEYFLLRKAYATEEHTLSFTVPLFDPLPPQYFIRVVSDRWLGCDISLPVSFRRLLLPEKFLPPTELLDLQPTTVTDLDSESAAMLFGGRVRVFNPIQTQVLGAVWRREENVLVAAPVGSGKSVVAELAVLHMLALYGNKGKCVYISPLSSLADERAREWRERFRRLSVAVVRLTGDVTVDAKLMSEGQLLVCTAREWETVTRRWKNRSVVKDDLALCILDDLHLISGEEGAAVEVVASRMRYIQTQLTHKRLRLLALSASIANAKDVGEWLGCSSSNTFNFPPATRPLPLEIRLHTQDILDFTARQLAMIKPAYRYIQQLGDGQPVILFTADQKQTKQLALSLTTLVAASDDPAKYIKGDRDALERTVTEAGIKAGGLMTCLLHGVGYLALGMPIAQRELIVRLYQQGSIRLLVLDYTLSFGLSTQVSAYLVLIMGTQYYSHQLHTHADLPITTLLQMTGYAGRPSIDRTSQLVLFTPTNKREFIKRFLSNPYPIESRLHHHLNNTYIHELISKRVEDVQEAIDYLTWSLLYRRLTLNPNYYNLTGTSHRHVSDWLSELVEGVVEDLKEANMLAVEEEAEQDSGGMRLSILNLGMITSYYNLDYTTVEIYNRSLKQATKLKGILETLCSSTEYDTLVVREREEVLLASIARHLPLPVASSVYTDPHVKANVLLQSHLSRSVPARFAADVSGVLAVLPRLISAMVDVLASNGWLLPALSVMELSQMAVQAMWNRDSPLKQIPHFTDDILRNCAKRGVQSVPDILDMDDDSRTQLLASLDPQQTADVARVCNAYPDIDLSYHTELEGGDKVSKGSVVRVRQGDTVKVSVRLSRDWDEAEDGAWQVPVIHSPYFPHVKTEGWWLVVGSTQRNELVSIKRVAMTKTTMDVSLDCVVSVAGEYEWQLYLMCDSWMGVDQENTVKLHVEPNDDMDDKPDE